MVAGNSRDSLLSVKDLKVSYEAIRALQGVCLDVRPGEIVSVIGSNGAGKSTLMNSIMGVVPYQAGEIRIDGRALSRKSYEIVSSGISLSPEGRKVFAPLTVYENLMIGAFPQSDSSAIQSDLEKIYGLFPRLAERKNQFAGTLSGGEQQMLAIGRAMMARPRVLLLDEPSLGLAPIIIKEIFKELKVINEQLGMTMLIVEQNARQALLLSHRTYILQTGQIIKEGKSSDLMRDPEIEQAYLGGKKR
jgi:branched-chain amino acid transport system ATP-binding protein